MEPVLPTPLIIAARSLKPAYKSINFGQLRFLLKEKRKYLINTVSIPKCSGNMAKTPFGTHRLARIKICHSQDPILQDNQLRHGFGSIYMIWEYIYYINININIYVCV